jgi:hypothetical protein
MAKADVLIEACESNGHVPSARDAKYMQFAERVRAAESIPIDKNIKVIQAFATESWQATVWMLERRRPQDFGKMSRHEFSDPEGGLVRQKHVVDVKQLTDAELEAIIRAGVANSRLALREFFQTRFGDRTGELNQPPAVWITGPARPAQQGQAHAQRNVQQFERRWRPRNRDYEYSFGPLPGDIMTSATWWPARIKRAG